jgi:hypothetical protein
VSRRTFLAATTALASTAITTLSVSAQCQSTKAKDGFHPSGDPGQRNTPLLDENPSSGTPHRLITVTLAPSGIPSI